MTLRPSHSLLLILAAILLMGCGHHRYDGELALVDSLQKFDSVYLSDSLLQPIVRYYDRWGTRNQQARAHYLLGRVYHLEGYLPQALDSYQQAAARADTTAHDRDYALLMKIYAQTSEVFKLQKIPYEQLSAIDKMRQYSWLAADTFNAIYSYYDKASPFYELGMRDSVVSISLQAYEMARKYGYDDLANGFLGGAIPVCIEQGYYQEGKRLIDLYCEGRRLFDSAGNIFEGGEIFYYSLGLYYLGIGKPDSAEHCFRKELQRGRDHNNQIYACRGLALLYDQQHKPDSALKYSQKAYTLNDSAYSLTVAGNLQQMQAAYDYQQFRDKAERLQISSLRHQTTNMWILLAILLTASLLLAYYHRIRQQQARSAAIIGALQSEKDMHETIIQHNREELKQLQTALKSLQYSQDYDTALQMLVSERRTHADEQLARSHIYNLIMERTREGGFLKDSEFKELQETVDKCYPRFTQTLHGLQKMSAQQMRVSLLLKLRLSTSAIATLTAHSPQAISNTCTRLYQKNLRNGSIFTNWFDFVISI